eukprot:CAMPEP_0117671124 /NCGR_PEP_ID=MMETSP0804-20121206/13155_1 /TAXON_ID=1074897 /ORGANISM="Tetraselmis astigmatica, Strain CCMP880" /LENGTH=100 /DNA_ID=CAMNT_0005479541 /DNA_START=457 /DNA_END=756 /DNA_ORIENTATION=-
MAPGVPRPPQVIPAVVSNMDTLLGAQPELIHCRLEDHRVWLLCLYLRRDHNGVEQRGEVHPVQDERQPHVKVADNSSLHAHFPEGLQTLARPRSDCPCLW